jgi:ABC-type amino acid transport substrate-binding protein
VFVRTWALGLAAFAAACTSGTAVSPSPTPADPLAALRARATLIVSIRMMQPPAQREQGDAAHEQKRALEAALAGALAQRILGTGARADLRNTGRDRTAPVASRDADIAMTAVDAAITGISFSKPYAAGGIDLVTIGSSIARIEDLAGKTVATTPGDADSAELARTFFLQRGITVTLQAFAGMRAAVDALGAGQIAAVAGDRAGVAVLNRERQNVLRTLSQLGARPFAVGVRNDSTALLAQVNEAIAALGASGELRKIAEAANFPYESP